MSLAMVGGRFECEEEVIEDRDRHNFEFGVVADDGRRTLDRDATVAMRDKFGSVMAPTGFK